MADFRKPWHSFASNRILIAVAALLFAVIAVLIAANYGLLNLGGAPQNVPVTTRFSGIVLPNKPKLSGSIVDNPDFEYGDYGWLAYANGSVDTRDLGANTRVLGIKTNWSGNGFAANSTFYGRNTVVVIHPFDTAESRYVQQTVALPVGKTYYLVFGLANLAAYYGRTGCDDNAFKVSILDKSDGTVDVLFEDALNTKSSWKDYMVGISKYAGKEITIRVDGIAGGPCGMWAGEWGAADYVDVLSTTI